MSTAEAAQRIRTALDLYEVGERMLRQRLRRERPEASAADIDRAIDVWLLHRPGAELGDHPGPTSTRSL